MAVLQNCFCGGKAEFEDFDAEHMELVRVICEKCQLATEWMSNRVEARQEWDSVQSSIEASVNGEGE